MLAECTCVVGLVCVSWCECVVCVYFCSCMYVLHRLYTPQTDAHKHIYGQQEPRPFHMALIDDPVIKRLNAEVDLSLARSLARSLSLALSRSHSLSLSLSLSAFVLCLCMCIHMHTSTPTHTHTYILCVHIYTLNVCAYKLEQRTRGGR